MAVAPLWSLPCKAQTGIGPAFARWWSGVYYSDEYIKKNKGKALVEIPEVFELANIAFNEYMTWAVFILYAHDNYDSQTFKTVNERVANKMVDDRKFLRFREFSDELLKLYVSRGEGRSLVDLYPAILEWSQAKPSR